MEANTKNATKTEMQALYTAFDIHRRIATLAAMWTAYDPFGAVAYTLNDFLGEAWDLREEVVNSKTFWNYTEEPYHPLRPIKKGKDNYATFKNHLKGIEGAIRRFLRNPWIAEMKDGRIPFVVKSIREMMAELRSQM